MTDPIRSLRIPDQIWDQAQDLAEQLKDEPELIAHGQVTRSTVLRLALVHGMRVLGKKYIKDANRK